MRYVLAVALLMLARPAVARDDVSVTLRYEAYSHRLPVMEMTAALRVAPSGYGVRVTYETVGVASLIYRGHEDDSVSGAWDEAGPAPRQYDAQGTWRGNQRETEVVYGGQVPTVAIAKPPIAEERQPVPANLLPGTIDTLSALVKLIRHVQATGSCDMSVRTFDGRRLSRIEAHTAGNTVLEPMHDSVFSGPALRCDFTGQMLAGFLLDHPVDQPVRPYHGSAWLARIVPGAPPLPVRLSFDTKWVGKVTMYLVGVTNELAPAARTGARAD